MTTPNDIPINYLRECLREEGGRLFWLRRPAGHFIRDQVWKMWNIRFADKEAGFMSTGQRWQVCFDKQNLMRSRIVWALRTGEWPAGEVDHWDRNRSNDRFENLRLATRSTNMANTKRRSHNTSGFKGVTRFAQKWRAKICVNNKEVHLGLHDTPEAAHEAYKDAAIKYFGEFANAG